MRIPSNMGHPAQKLPLIASIMISVVTRFSTHSGAPPRLWPLFRVLRFFLRCGLAPRNSLSRTEDITQLALRAASA